MTSATFLRIAIQPAATLLPPAMNTPNARALVLAICRQESRLVHRRQLHGPARGFAQFELAGGVVGVLTHPSTKAHIEGVLQELSYPPAASACYEAIEHNDILACVFARLLLWTDPHPLPASTDADGAWATYERTWRPGKPHRASFNPFFAEAWATVEGY